MSENKRILIVCIGITIICIILIVVFNSDWFSTFATNIFISIGTGSISSALVSYISFKYQKREIISTLKRTIYEEIEDYLDLFYSIDYIYFKDRLSHDLKDLDMNEDEINWLDSLILNNQNMKIQNIKTLNKLKNLNSKHLHDNINKLSQLQSKLNTEDCLYALDKIEEVKNRIIHFEFSVLDKNTLYEQIQNIIFRNESTTNNVVIVNNNSIEPTPKINIIIEKLNNFDKQLI